MSVSQMRVRACGQVCVRCVTVKVRVAGGVRVGASEVCVQVRVC